MKVFVAESWLGGSHRAWAEGYRRSSRHDVTVLGLEPAGWKWRLRAGAAPLAALVAAAVRRAGQWPDAIIVSGLVDVSSFLGHLRAPTEVTVVAYMHESQLVYPTINGNVDGDAVQRNWDSWLAADAVWFNSEFHRRSVVDALPAWASSLPESLSSDLIDEVTSSFEVRPVGVDTVPAAEQHRMQTESVPPPARDRPIVLWPHRWEPDKAPEVFARAVDRLVAAGADFDLVLAGEDPAGSMIRSELIERHGDRVLAVGPFLRIEYERWLRRSDVVVSCAEHEFFGVAVVEAALAGCVPVLPNALSYPELIPSSMQSSVLYERGRFGTRLLDVLSDLPTYRDAVGDLPRELSSLGWSIVAPDYDRRLDELVTPCGVGSPRC